MMKVTIIMTTKSKEVLTINLKKKYLLIASVIITFITAYMTTRDDGYGGRIFGYPADVFQSFGGWTNSYHVWGFLFNVLFYYIILFILTKILTVITTTIVKKFKK